MDSTLNDYDTILSKVQSMKEKYTKGKIDKTSVMEDLRDLEKFVTDAKNSFTLPESPPAKKPKKTENSSSKKVSNKSNSSNGSPVAGNSGTTSGRGRGRGRPRGTARGTGRARTKPKTQHMWLPKDPYERACFFKTHPDLKYHSRRE